MITSHINFIVVVNRVDVSLVSLVRVSLMLTIHLDSGIYGFTLAIECDTLRGITNTQVFSVLASIKFH